MVSIDKVQRGVSRYLDEQLMPHMQGKNRWIVTGVATLYLSKLPQLIQTYAEKPAIKALGLVTQDGAIDIEAIFNSVRPAARVSPAEINIPLAGSISITEQDLDMMLRYIMQA